MSVQAQTFSSAFKNNFESVSNLSRKRQKGLEDFIRILSQRLDCEATYSKSLHTVGSMSHGLTQGSLFLCLQGFQIDCLNRAEQSTIFVDNTKAEILEPLKLMLKEHEACLKSYSSQVSSLEREMRNVHERLKKSKMRYERTMQEAEEVLFECEDIRKSEKKEADSQEKLNLKMAEAVKTYKENWDAYKAYVKYATEHKEQYEKNVAGIVDVFQKQEEQRIQVLRDSIKKLFIFQASLEQNHKYDVKQVSENADQVNVAKDIEILIDEELFLRSKEQKEELLNQPKIILEKAKSGWGKLFEVYENSYAGREDQMDYPAIVEETKQFILEHDDSEYKKSAEKITAFCEILTKPDNVPKSISDEIQKEMENPKGRIAFVNILTKFKNEGKNMLNQDGYKNLAIILLQFLDTAYAKMESELIYMAFLAAEDFYWTDEAAQECLLFAVKTHMAWRDTKMWQKIIRRDIEKEIRIIRGNNLREKMKGPGILPQLQDVYEKNKVHEILERFLKDIAVFALDKEELRNISLEYCKEYKLPVRQIDSLMAIIDKKEKGEENKKDGETKKSQSIEPPKEIKKIEEEKKAIVVQEKEETKTIPSKKSEVLNVSQIKKEDKKEDKKIIKKESKTGEKSPGKSKKSHSGHPPSSDTDFKKKI